MQLSPAVHVTDSCALRHELWSFGMRAISYNTHRAIVKCQIGNEESRKARPVIGGWLGNMFAAAENVALGGGYVSDSSVKVSNLRLVHLRTRALSKCSFHSCATWRNMMNTTRLIIDRTYGLV